MDRPTKFEEGQIFQFYNPKQQQHHQFVVSKAAMNRVAAIFDDGSVIDFAQDEVTFLKLTFVKNSIPGKKRFFPRNLTARQHNDRNLHRRNYP